MNQNFFPQQLIKLIKKSELNDYRLTMPEVARLLDDVYVKINDGSFEFNLKNINGNYLTEDLIEKLVLRKLNDNLKRLYKDEQSNRRIIISQIKTLLEETCPMFVLKTDIQSFYESIQRKRIVEKLEDDGMLSYYSLKLIGKVFTNALLIEKSGLPRGLNISSTLSEIHMRKFDRWLREFDGVYYYARYVDDIIIFTNQKENAEKIKEEININLETGLRKNESKTDVYTINRSLTRPIEYLGYKFTTKKNKKDKLVIISIADKKVKKIKTRIVNSFLDYIKTNDFDLLHNRIKFLTGNFSIRTSPEGNELKAGIYYNYSYLNDFSVLNNLNVFYRKIIASKRTSFGRQLDLLLTTGKKDILSKYSFIHGHKNKVYYNFKPEKINQIKMCWS